MNFLQDINIVTILALIGMALACHAMLHYAKKQDKGRRKQKSAAAK